MKATNNHLLNSTIEVALRVLVILTINCSEKFDVERLGYYDYVSTRLNDYNDKFKSLHPYTPYKHGELIVKRELIQSALALLLKKDLVKIEYGTEGVNYYSNKYSSYFLSHFKSEYYLELCKHVEVASNNLSNIKTEDLRKLFKRNINKMEMQFKFECLIRGEDFEKSISDKKNRVL